MRNKSTNFSLTSRGQTYQNCKTALNTATVTRHLTKLKWLMLIVCALIMIVVSSAMAQPAGPMVAGTYALTGSVTWYDPGGAGGGACPSAVSGNYANNLNITETMTANAGQRIVVSWTGGLFGLSTGDVLTVYDGPTTASPVLATYTGTVTNPIPAVIVATSSNSITFRFISDATNTCKGWQATVASYYFMSNGSYSFSCPGTYQFVDYQQVGSGGPGGDGTCISSGGNTKDYQDANVIETFSTTNGQCISIDPSFPSNFGICSGDTLKVFDGPSIASPIANSGTAVYTNTWTNPTGFSTVSSSTTFQFISSNDFLNHTRGWQIGLSCTNCPATSPNNDCANAQPLTPQPTCNYISGSVAITNSNANPFLAPTCTGANTANDDVWYSFNAINNTATITVAASDATMDPVVQLFSGTCGSFTSLSCVNATAAGGTETINATGLTPGNTYYVRVYDAAATNANHTFNICVVSTANTDCVTASQVCSNAMLTHTAYNYPDYGTNEYNSSYWGCDYSGEIRSAWYYFQLATSGTFGFTISALSGSTYMDNDFVLWGPMTGLNCPMNTTPLRCDYSIAYSSNSYGLPPYSTGLQMAESDLSSGASGNAFVQTVNGTANQWYVLMVNIWTGPSTYHITWMDGIPSNQQATFVSSGTGCGLLPIELLSFTGENVGADNVLKWITASETNNDYFAIERSPDGEHFTELGSIKAAGTSTSETKYYYPDHAPLHGTNFYRLRQADLDGTYSYSNIIAIENGSSDSFTPFVYPNPSEGVFNISIRATSNTDVTLGVYNAIGQLVTATQRQVQDGDNKFTVDLSSYNQGVYTLFIRDSHSGKVYANKIVKL